jgi:two-component system, NtrC family, nitrogen regulation response regulator GlnG
MKPHRILLVEDDAAIAVVIRVALESEQCELEVAGSIAQRDNALTSGRFDAVITDVILPDGNGLRGLGEVKDASGTRPPVIVLSAQNTLDTAVRASAEGAFDYLPKPFDLDELISAVRSAVSRKGDAADLAEADIQTDDYPIIGRAPAMQQVYRTLARVAPTDLSVLIMGESGTGKELVAAAIHNSSRRRLKPFVAVNMAALPRELIESELFGHEKGAFTGAVARTAGRFEQAEGGTLFLDEIGDMPIEAQTRLLRVLQSGDYSPVGSARVVRADVRIIAATNKNLPEQVEAGAFREDLYYRLNVIPMELPPLRQRRSDIGLLAQHFLSQGVARGLPQRALSEAAVHALERHDWPGNVRELGNAMQRLALLTRNHLIEIDDVERVVGPVQPANVSGDLENDAMLGRAVLAWLDSPEAKVAAETGELHHRLVTLVEQQMIDFALERTAGNQIRAASMLGINRNTLRLKRRS